VAEERVWDVLGTGGAFQSVIIWESIRRRMRPRELKGKSGSSSAHRKTAEGLIEPGMGRGRVGQTADLLLKEGV